MNHFTCIGSLANDKCLATDPVKLKIIKAKKRLILWQNVISFKNKAKLAETFVNIVPIYDKSGAVYGKVDDNKLHIIQNTVR